MLKSVYKDYDIDSDSVYNRTMERFGIDQYNRIRNNWSVVTSSISYCKSSCYLFCNNADYVEKLQKYGEKSDGMFIERVKYNGIEYRAICTETSLHSSSYI